MVFPYRSFQVGREIRYVPLLSVLVHGNDRHLSARVLLDSGADHTIIHRDFAHRLGIELGKKVTILGVGGVVAGYLGQAALSFDSRRWKTQVIFSDGVDVGSGLLGQLGFFEYHTVIFDYSRKSIEVKRARLRRGAA